MKLLVLTEDNFTHATAASHSFSEPQATGHTPGGIRGAQC